MSSQGAPVVTWTKIIAAPALTTAQNGASRIGQVTYTRPGSIERFSTKPAADFLPSQEERGASKTGETKIGYIGKNILDKLVNSNKKNDFIKTDFSETKKSDKPKEAEKDMEQSEKIPNQQSRTLYEKEQTMSTFGLK